ncbi:MAG: hypothetical protein ABEJ08_06025 [Halobacteriaceae archaeon]
MTATGVADLSLPDNWAETGHARGRYGPDGTAGRTVTIERDTMELSVVPVRYQRSDGEESIVGLTRDLQLSRPTAAAVGTTTAPVTGFALYAACEPAAARRTTVVCVAVNADDALAAAVWLARASDTDWDLQDHLDGRDGSAAWAAGITDDDALGALFADEPDRCVVTGQPTRSHDLELPFRYYPLFDGARSTDRGVPRIPSTVSHLTGRISHTAWEAHGLGDVAPDTPVQRDRPGEYRLHPDLAAAASEMTADRFALHRLSDVPA